MKEERVEDRVTPESKTAGSNRAQWRSLEELAGSAEFQEHAATEFPDYFTEQLDLPAAENAALSRRSFLGVMGASLALTGLAGCQRPLAKILPYSKLPEDLLPGVPQSYATVFPFRGMGEGILVTSNEGRPTKIEGNPDHPASLGATHGYTQASILQLYDPDRSQFPTEGNASRTWDEFNAWLTPKLTTLRGEGGRGLAFVSLPTASPSVRAKRAEVMAAFPNARWVDYEPVNRDNAIQGSRLAFGRPMRQQLALDQADVIVSLDSDFLFIEPNSVRHARDYARRRQVTPQQASMNRLYMVETAFSITGSMADHRLRVAPSQVAEVARALAFSLSANHHTNLGGQTWAQVKLSDTVLAFVERMAHDLSEHRGRGVVLVGLNQPPEVHALAMVINHALGSVGTVVRYTAEPYPGQQRDNIVALAQAIDHNEVNFLVILGGNPAYDAPADIDFTARMRKVPDIVCLSLYRDETAEKGNWHLPETHYLEAWGDAEAWDGTRSIQQPLIAPMYQAKSEIELLSLFLGRAADSHALVQEYYGREWGLPSSSRWDHALNDGFLPTTTFAEIAGAPDMNGVAGAWSRRTAPAANGIEVLFRPDYSVWDGRYANNSWMQ